MLSDWGEIRKPDVFTWKNVGWAVVVHLVFFTLCWLLSLPLTEKEVAIPIDLTVVVNENLDGDPDEPPPEAPPVKQPDPPPPPPKPQPKVEAPPPPPPEVKQDAVVQKKVVKKPEKPKPTKEELKKLREERLKKMRESAKKAKPEKTKPQPKQPTRADRLKAMRDALNDGTPPKYNGKTDKRPDNWKDLLNRGYKPGAHTQIASSENQRCISLIKMRFDTCWAQVGVPPWTDTLKEMHLRLKFSGSGKITSFSLAQSSGDRRVDQTVLQAAKLMNAVAGLSPEFLESNGGGVTIRVKVMPK